VWNFIEISHIGWLNVCSFAEVIPSSKLGNSELYLHTLYDYIWILHFSCHLDAGWFSKANVLFFL